MDQTHSRDGRQRRYSRLEVGWVLLQLAAAAAVSLDNGGWEHRANGGWGSGDNSPRIPVAGSKGSPSLTRAASGSAGRTQVLQSTTAEPQIKSAIYDIFGGGPWTHGGAASGPRPRHGGIPIVGTGKLLPPAGWKRGTLKRIGGETDKSVNILQHERDVLDALPAWHDREHYTDLMELYSGEAGPTVLARQYGLTAVQPFDKNEGYDLNETTTQRLCNRAINELKPLLLLIGFDCRNWNLLNENANYKHRIEVLEQHREEERPTLRWVCKRCIDQVRNGRLFVLENPIRSRLWEEDCVMELAAMEGLRHEG